MQFEVLATPHVSVVKHPPCAMSISTRLKVGWHREHFLSPLLQLAERDAGETFELVECPGGTGEMQVKLREGEIDVCIGMLVSG